MIVVEPAGTPEPAATPAPLDIQGYANAYAGRAGAVYAGDLDQLVGSTAVSGIVVTKPAIEHSRWLFESEYYQSLLTKARLTNPTKLTSNLADLELRVACFREEDCTR